MIRTDRMRFSEVYRITEEYCRNNVVIISRVDKIVSESDEKKEFGDVYNLYCSFPYKHATNLSNLIHDGVGEWVKMRTIVGYQEFVIEYDMRPLINLYSIDAQKNVKLHALIMPMKIDNLFYMSPEIEIIDVYHKLYSPNESDNWADLLETETKLYDLLLRRMKSGVFGGAENVSAPSPEDNTDLQYLKYLVLSEFCGEFIKDYVVVGHWALHVVEASKEDDYKMRSSVEKIQVVTSIDIEKAVEDIVQFLKKYTNAKIVSRVQDLHIPKDFRINRYTIYIGVPSKNNEIKEKAFMDIFNCGNFELIPYIPVSLNTRYGSMVKDVNYDENHNRRRLKKSSRWRRGGGESYDSDEFLVKIGNPFVLMRFLIIDLWIIRVIHGMGYLTTNMLRTKTKYIMHVVEKIKDPSLGLLEKMFGVDYVGVYKDYDISKKINNLKSKPFFPYYPEREMINRDQYKVV